MRILFVGTVDFSRHCLAEVIDGGGEVVGVLTLARDRAKFNSDYADLGPAAREHGVPVHRIGNINGPESRELIQSLKPDVMFVFGWSQLISKPILEIPPLGCIGTHPALLPKNRGRHPLVWALVEGLDKSGLTFFYLDEGADSGDIIWQNPFPITLDDDAGILYEKIKLLASKGIREFLPKLQQGTASRLPQDHSKATYWRKRGPEDGEIHWANSTMQSYNLIRALARPYVGAHTSIGGQEVKLWQAALPDVPVPPEAQELAPGTVFHVGERELAVRTGDGFLIVRNYEAADGGVINNWAKLGASS